MGSYRGAPIRGTKQRCSYGDPNQKIRRREHRITQPQQIQQQGEKLAGVAGHVWTLEELIALLK